MKLSEFKPGYKAYTQLSSTCLAVLVIEIDGWRVYVDGVPGERHEDEWQDVALYGNKQREPIARAIVENLFYPGFEIDLPYAK